MVARFQGFSSAILDDERHLVNRMMHEIIYSNNAKYQYRSSGSWHFLYFPTNYCWIWRYTFTDEIHNSPGAMTNILWMVFTTYIRCQGFSIRVIWIWTSRMSLTCQLIPSAPSISREWPSGSISGCNILTTSGLDARCLGGQCGVVIKISVRFLEAWPLHA